MSKSKRARRSPPNSRNKPSKEPGLKRSTTASAELKTSPFRIAPGMLRDPVWMIATVCFALIALSTLTKNGLWISRCSHLFLQCDVPVLLELDMRIDLKIILLSSP